MEAVAPLGSVSVEFAAKCYKQLVRIVFLDFGAVVEATDVFPESIELLLFAVRLPIGFEPGSWRHAKVRPGVR